MIMEEILNSNLITINNHLIIFKNHHLIAMRVNKQKIINYNGSV